MPHAQSLVPACALAIAAMMAFSSSASGSPQDSTLDAQIEHALSGCADTPPEKTVFGIIPPGFDYRFTVTSSADAHPVLETHLTLAGGWEKSFRKPAVRRAAVGDLKRELRLTGSKAPAWLLAAESQIDDFLKQHKPGKPVTYEVALLGCTGTAGSYDAVMALKDFEVGPD